MSKMVEEPLFKRVHSSFSEGTSFLPRFFIAPIPIPIPIPIAMGYHTELPKPYRLVPLPIPLSSASPSAATLIARGHRIKLAADLGLARALLLRRRHRRRSRRGVVAPLSKPYEAEIGGGGADDGGEGEKEEEEEEEGVEERVSALRRLVPGGEGMGVETLFEETADYIEALQGQVSAMRALTSLLDGSERESSTSTSTSTTTSTTMNTMDV